MKSKIEEYHDKAMIKGLIIGAGLITVIWAFVAMAQEPKIVYVQDDPEIIYIENYTNRIIDTSSDYFDWKEIQIMLLEDKIQKLNESNKIWQGKWNNIIPLYQKLDRDYRNYTNWVNKNLVFPNNWCGSNSVTYVDRTTEVINEVPVIVEVPREIAGHKHHGHERDD